MEFLADYGLAGLFLASFLAATLIPLSSEALLVIVMASTDQILLPVVVASAGNIAGSMLNYYLGYKGNYLLLHKILRMSERDMQRAGKWFRKYGSYSTLFAWVPVIGDPLTVVAGLFKMNIYIFTILVALGKSGRYVVIAYGFSLF